MQTVKFLTLGCKVNQYEIQSIREQFLRSGFKELENCSPADICVINTCTVTHRADSESFNFVRRAKRENPRAKIIVTGCLAECRKQDIKAIDKNIFVVKNTDKHKLVNLVFPASSLVPRPSSLVTSFKGHTRAFLKIQDGCDNFCSYCIVPYVRGRPRSKGIDQIMQEAGALAGNGHKEIVLTGICLGAYGKDLKPKSNIVKVICRLESIPGLERIRLSSIEPQHVSDALINRISVSGKLCKHLHIPLQSGDDRILLMMNRKYSASDYLRLAARIKEKAPEASITTDVIVGFPGEGRDNFTNTVSVIKQIIPLRVHIFPYSRREGTKAAGFAGEASRAEQKLRIALLRVAAREGFSSYCRRFLNKKLPVLIEGPVKERRRFWQGYSDTYIKVLIKSEKDLHNTLIPLKIKKLCHDHVIADFN